MSNRFPAMIFLAALSACAASPEPGYFSLTSIAGAALPAAVTVRLQRPALSGYLDRPEFVQQTGDFQVDIHAMERWAEPLDTMFARVMADDLRQRLPASHVVTEGETDFAAPRFTVAVNIDHFNQTADGDVLLEGEMTVKDNNARTPEDVIPIKFTADSGASPNAISSSLSVLVGHAADRLAEAIARDASQVSR